jgi:hypothetical protein
MTIEQGLTTFLLTDPAVVAFIGQRFGPWTGQLDPQESVTYELTTEDNVYTLGGCSDEPTATFVISCWGSTQTRSRQIASAIKNSRGGASSGPRLKELGSNGRPALLGSVVVSAALISDVADNENPPVDGSNAPIPCVKLSLQIAYQEQ